MAGTTGGSRAAARAPLLSGLSEDGWRVLLAHTEGLTFAAGDVVLQAGDRDRSLCLVSEGELEVLVAAAGGGRRRLAIFEEGSVFGEQSFLDAGPRSADVRALTPGRMRVLSHASFEDLPAAYPELALGILLELGRVVSERLRGTTAYVTRLFADGAGGVEPPAR